MVRFSRANLSASRCTLVTSGQVASITFSERSLASCRTVGGTPCALKTSTPPCGTSSMDSTKIAPRRRNCSTTYVLWTISWCTYTGAPYASSANSTMSTARTTPAQKPRGRTLSKIFPLSVCIIILMNSFRRLYHTSLGFLVAPAFGLGLPIGQHSWRRMITLLEAARKPAQFGSCCICILGNCSPLAAWQASPGNTYVRGYSWDGRTCRAGDDYFSWLGRGPLGANSSDLMRGIVLDLWRNMPCVLCTTGRRIFRGDYP